MALLYAFFVGPHGRWSVFDIVVALFTFAEFVSRKLSYNVSSVSANVAEDFSVMLELGAASAEEVVALASFTSIIQVVFAPMFDIDVPMVTVSSVEATSSSAILIAFRATGVREPRSQLQRLYRECQRCRGFFCNVGVGSCRSRGGCGFGFLHIDHPGGLCPDVEN